MFLASENIDFTGLAHVFLLGGGERGCLFYMPGSIVHLGFEHGAGGGVDLVLIFHSVGPEFDLITVASVVLVQLTLEAGYGRGAETCVGQSGTLGGRGVDGDGGRGGRGVPVVVTVPLRTPDRAVGSQDLVFIFQAASSMQAFFCWKSSIS